MDETEALAIEAGISHPAYKAKSIIMTSDFLVDSTNDAEPKYALQAKYSDSLQDARTVEKLELERRYWAKKSIPWQLITEKQIPATLLENINWLYPTQRDQIDENILHDRIEFYSHFFKRNPHRLITEIAKQMDAAYTCCGSIKPDTLLRELNY